MCGDGIVGLVISEACRGESGVGGVMFGRYHGVQSEIDSISRAVNREKIEECMFGICSSASLFVFSL